MKAWYCLLLSVYWLERVGREEAEGEYDGILLWGGDWGQGWFAAEKVSPLLLLPQDRREDSVHFYRSFFIDLFLIGTLSLCIYKGEIYCDMFI